MRPNKDGLLWRRGSNGRFIHGVLLHARGAPRGEEACTRTRVCAHVLPFPSRLAYTLGRPSATRVCVCWIIYCIYHKLLITTVQPRVLSMGLTSCSDPPPPRRWGLPRGSRCQSTDCVIQQVHIQQQEVPSAVLGDENVHFNTSSI